MCERKENNSSAHFSKNLLPINFVGELYIGGIQLARGYINDKEQTSQAFVPSPFVPDECLYKTGDLAKRNLKGEIEYIGRKDSQVKIRGYRIELGEIERALEILPNVTQAVVKVKKQKEINVGLIGYVSTTNKLLKITIREQLKDLVPDYMIPSEIVILNELPLSENGKINRKVLTLPEGLQNDAKVEILKNGK